MSTWRDQPRRGLRDTPRSLRDTPRGLRDTARRATGFDDENRNQPDEAPERFWFNGRDHHGHHGGDDGQDDPK
jgi:hypothetical protein